MKKTTMNSNSLICGSFVQEDRSGVGHCWVAVDVSTMPKRIVAEIEEQMIDGGREECDDFRASNGLHYRW